MIWARFFKAMKIVWLAFGYAGDGLTLRVRRLMRLTVACMALLVYSHQPGRATKQAEQADKERALCSPSIRGALL